MAAVQQYIRRYDAVSAIDTAFRVYREHFKVLFAISLVVNVPAALVGVVTTLIEHRIVAPDGALGSADLTQWAPVLGTLGAFVILGLLLSLVAAIFGLAASTRVASLAALGRVPTLADALGEAKAVFWPLSGVSVLTSLATFAGSLFFIVPGVIIYLGLAFAGPVVVLEHKGVSEALDRSWRLSRGRRWRILGVLVLVFLMIGMVSGGFALLVGGLGLERGLLAGLIQAILDQAVSVVGTPVWYVALVLLYYDARVEHEAFDVELLAKSPSLPAADGSADARLTE